MPSTSLCGVRLRQVANDFLPFYLPIAVTQVIWLFIYVSGQPCWGRGTPPLVHAVPRLPPHAAAAAPCARQPTWVPPLTLRPLQPHATRLQSQWIGIAAFSRPEPCNPGSSSTDGQQYAVVFVCLAFFIAQAAATCALTLLTLKGAWGAARGRAWGLSHVYDC